MTPDKYTIQELMLDVGDSHQLYIHDWGNKKAKTPVIYFHGGPGSSVDDRAKRSFDPTIQRVIFYDQRGCGKSTPYGSLEHNTTADLVDDIVQILDHAGAKQAVLFGGSWGSTLALAFALAHPSRVKAMCIRGIFTSGQSELDWIEKGLYRVFYPEVWDQLLEHTPEKHRANAVAYHYKQALHGATPADRAASALALEETEGHLLNMDDRHAPLDPTNFDPTSARIEAHYLSNKCFLEPSYILSNAHKLKMPVHLVQGRYDMVCPPITAYQLHATLPNSRLYWTISNHRMDHEIENIVRAILLELGQ